MKTSSRKGKGRRHQQWVVDRIREKYNFDLQHIGLNYYEGDIQCVPMGISGEDVKLSPKAEEIIPFSIEAKNTERLNLWESIKQAEENAKNRIPLVVFKRNRSKVYCIIEFDKLLEVIK